MAQKHLKPNITQTVLKYKQKLNQALPIEKIIVFGSQVKGTAKPYSDIDVCVVSKKLGKDRHAERVMLLGLADDVDIRLEPHPYHPKDLKDKWDSLASEIRHTGVTI